MWSIVLYLAYAGLVLVAAIEPPGPPEQPPADQAAAAADYWYPVTPRPPAGPERLRAPRVCAAARLDAAITIGPWPSPPAAPAAALPALRMAS